MRVPDRSISKNYRFGQQLLALRKKAGLTQDEMAGRVGVSEKALRNWEGGASYPTQFNLRKLIETFLLCAAFTPGAEGVEIRAFWDLALEHSSRLLPPLDEEWLADLLPSASVVSATHADWGEAPDVAAFCGREHELDELERRILGENCRVVALLGMGGIGKTSLAARLAHQIAPHFECVIWRSLRNAPALSDILADCLTIISRRHDFPLSQTVEQGVELLLELLRERRCLLILDNMETLLQAGMLEGRYRAGYEDYGLLLQRLAETAHQSCLLLTSREMPVDLELMQGLHPIRTLKVFGLGHLTSQEILKDWQLSGTPAAWDVLVKKYAGNPLTLKIVAATIQEVFGGNIAAFLHQGPVILHTVRQLLDYQFERLSPLERQLMFWLAIERDRAPLEELICNLPGSAPRREVLAALQTLRWRWLVERAEQAAVFTLHEVVLEYITERFVEQVSAEIIESTPDLLLSHALLKAQSKDYIRESQVRMILQPVLGRLIAAFGDEQRLEQHLLKALSWLREQPFAVQGYGGGNVVNLLAHLNGQMRGKDLSSLLIREAYLQGIEAQDASFAGSELVNSRFTEPIESLASMALSPDGNYLAVGGFSGQLYIWQVEDGRPLAALKAHTGITWTLAFSPDSSILASGSYDTSVKLWDIKGQMGHCLGVLRNHEKWVRTVAFSPDGSLLATCGEDKVVCVWDVRSQTCLHTLHGHPGVVWSLAFSPDGSLLVTGGEDEMVRMWDVSSGDCLRVLHGHIGRVMTVAFHPTGKLFTSGGEDGRINLWETKTGKRLTSLRLGASKAMSIVFSSDGNVLASGSANGVVEVWSLAGEQGPHLLRTLQGHNNVVNAVAFGPDNHQLASASYSGSVKFWDVTSGRCLRTLQGYSSVISSLAFNPDGRLLAQGDDNGMLKVWKIEDEQTGFPGASRRLGVVRGHADRVWSLAFSPAGNVFASGGDDQVIKLWEVGKEGRLRCLKTFLGHTVFIGALAFSPAGHLLASGSFDRTVKLWGTKKEDEEACRQTFLGHESAVWSVAFNPTGRLLASGDNSGEIRLWEVESGRCLQILHSETSPIGALAFARDGATLLSSSNDGVISRWDTASGARLQTFQGEGLVNWIGTLAFSQDGARLAAGNNDHTVKLWQFNATDGIEVLQSLAWQDGQSWSVAFSPDGRLLASGDDHGALALWQVETGRLCQILRDDRPYERMNIRSLKGLTPAQENALLALGAVEAE